MKVKKSLGSKKISFGASTIILAISIIHITITAISIHNNPSTSFPWWTAFYFPGIIYLIPFTGSLLVFLYFLIKEKNTKI